MHQVQVKDFTKPRNRVCRINSYKLHVILSWLFTDLFTGEQEVDYEKLLTWTANTRWKVVWTPESSGVLPQTKDLHEHWIESLHKTYPLMKRQHNRPGALATKVQLIACNISSTLPETDIENASVEDIVSYNEDLEAYIEYVNSGSVLNDGVHNLKKNVVVAVAPERKNGIPWFGRVLEVEEDKQEVKVRWMDRLQSKTIYFYLTNDKATIHYETIICNGVQMEPVLEEKLMWKLITPLSFIQSMNSDTPPELLQQKDNTIVAYKKKKKFDLSQMIFANSEEFLEFAKVLM